MAQFTEIKFPKGLARFLVCDRKMVSKYQTNRTVKLLGFYAALKSTNTCGVIKDFTGQLPDLLAVCKVSRTLFYTRLKQCEKLELLTIKGKHQSAPKICLTSWDKVCEMFDVEFTGHHTINYDLHDTKKTPEHFINLIHLQEKDAQIRQQISKKLSSNPTIKKGYEIYAKLTNNEKPFTATNLFEAQRKSYSEGAPEGVYEVLHQINPDPNRCVKSIQKDFSMKSHRSSTYLKRNLEKRGMISIQKREPSICNYTETLGPLPTNNGFVSVNFFMPSVAKKRAKKDNCYHTWYSKAEGNRKIRTWFITDSVKITPNLIN